jgi:hypothetical protein
MRSGSGGGLHCSVGACFWCDGGGGGGLSKPEEGVLLLEEEGAFVLEGARKNSISNTGLVSTNLVSK